jgi:DNA-binding cell septation regulator SpoVG
MSSITLTEKDVRVVKMRKAQEGAGNILANFSILTYLGPFAVEISDFRYLKGEKGNFVGAPSRKDRDGKRFWDIFRAAEYRDQNALLSALIPAVDAAYQALE